jgi:hypothetical protein
LQYYPDFLLTGNIVQVAKSWKKYLRSNIESVCRDYETEKRVIQRSLIFNASSAQFREKFKLSRDDCFLFLPDEKRKKRAVKISLQSFYQTD